MFDAVGEHDAATHAVAEHDACRTGMLLGGDPDQGVEVAGVFGDVLEQHPLAARAAVSAMVERVGHQSIAAEPRSDVVVATGMLAQPVRQDHHPANRGIGSPDVIDDAHTVDTVEGSVRHAWLSSGAA